MARANKSKSIKRRDTPRIASSVFRTQPELPFGVSLTPIEDRRTFHPLGEKRPARSFRQRVSQIRVTPSTPAMLSKPSSMVSHGLSFQAPRDVLVCVRRHARREVLHALNKAGKSGQRRPRRTQHSNVRC